MNPSISTNLIRSLLPTSTALDMGKISKTKEKMESTTFKILRVQEEASSFIKHVEVMERGGKVLQVVLVFNKENPNDINLVPSNKSKSDLFHTHKANYHRLTFKNPVNIKEVLNLVEQTHQFTGNAKFEAYEIRKKLFVNSAKL